MNRDDMSAGTWAGRTESASSASLPQTATHKIECKGLWKIFGDGAKAFLQNYGQQATDEALQKEGLIAAVRNVDIEIREGEIFVIMGLSGSGKSTLIRCMSRLIPVSAGEMLIEGRDLASMSVRELRQLRRDKMGMVFQHFALLPHLTILANVAFPLEIQGVERRVREEKARKIIDLVGLSGREHYYPRQLSGGQQQRVGIARALVVEPDIWFLDEPFSALDPLIRREMQDEFLRLQSMLHETVVFITHDFLEAVRLADRIAIMRNGVIEQVGTPEELVMHPATEYIAKFSGEVPRAKVLTARSIMVSIADGLSEFPNAAEKQNAVAANTRVEAFASRVLDAGNRVPVTDREGVIGYVDPIHVLDVVLNRYNPP